MSEFGSLVEIRPRIGRAKLDARGCSVLVGFVALLFHHLQTPVQQLALSLCSHVLLARIFRNRHTNCLVVPVIYFSEEGPGDFEMIHNA